MLSNRLALETNLLEDWRDVAVFDVRQDEETVSLDDYLRSPVLEI